MKIQCNKCKKDMGEILTGSRLRNGIVYLCEQCMDKYKVFEDLADYGRGAEPKNDYKGTESIPDFLKDLLKGKK